MPDDADAQIFKSMLITQIIVKLDELATDEILDVLGHLILRERFKGL